MVCLQARVVKEVDAGGEKDKAHAKLVAKGKEGRGGWQRVVGYVRARNLCPSVSILYSIHTNV